MSEGTVVWGDHAHGMASGLEPLAPFSWGVALDEYVRALRRGPCVEARDWTVEHPTCGVHSGRWTLGMVKDARC